MDTVIRVLVRTLKKAGVTVRHAQMPDGQYRVTAEDLDALLSGPARGKSMPAKRPRGKS